MADKNVKTSNKMATMIRYCFESKTDFIRAESALSKQYPSLRTNVRDNIDKIYFYVESKNSLIFDSTVEALMKNFNAQKC